MELTAYFPITFFAAISMSSDLIVFRPACIAKSNASLAILHPISSNAFASSFAAASLTRSAPAFLHNLCMGATANSKSVICDSPQLLFVFKAILKPIASNYGFHIKHIQNKDQNTVNQLFNLNRGES